MDGGDDQESKGDQLAGKGYIHCGPGTTLGHSPRYLAMTFQQPLPGNTRYPRKSCRRGAQGSIPMPRTACTSYLRRERGRHMRAAGLWELRTCSQVSRAMGHTEAASS